MLSHGVKPRNTSYDYNPLNHPIHLHAHKYRRLHGRKTDWPFPLDMLHFKLNQH